MTRKRTFGYLIKNYTVYMIPQEIQAIVKSPHIVFTILEMSANRILNGFGKQSDE